VIRNGRFLPSSRPWHRQVVATLGERCGPIPGRKIGHHFLLISLFGAASGGILRGPGAPDAEAEPGALPVPARRRLWLVQRFGFAPKEAHLLRHSLATKMLRRGASLGEIGQLLRHRQPTTTQIYAKVDIKALRTIALPWMGGAL
jgi:integrase